MLDIWGALQGHDLLLTLALVLVILYSIWIYNWSKKQLGQKIGAIFTVFLIYITVIQFEFLIWVPIFIWFLNTFGKEFLKK